MSERFKFIEDILKNVSEEEGVDIEEVYKIWDHHEESISSLLRDPLAPNVIINGMFKLRPGYDLITKDIFRNLHVSRKSSDIEQGVRNRARVVELLKIQSRLLKERQSYKHNKTNGKKAKELAKKA